LFFGSLTDWEDLVGPAVIAAAVSGIISVIAMLVNRSTTVALHREKIDADIKLAREKFEFDKDLAERKILHDMQNSDRRKRQELAEDLIAGFLEVQDTMQSIRSPFGYGGEGATRPREPNETADQTRRKDSQYVTFERFERHRETIAKLMSLRHRASAWFGNEIREPFLKINQAINSVMTSAKLLSEPLYGEMSSEEKTMWTDMRRDVWSHGDENDKIAAQIISAVSQIEEICRPVLESKEI
jgi:hypothetical protein